VIIFLVDDLGKEWVSCYGARGIQTPNVDKLAKTGVRFENVYSMPQSTPSRVSILTGQYPFRHGWVNHWDVPRWGGGAHFDETQNPTIANQMKKAGYKTCIAGKWQIDDFRVESDALTKVGFDEFCMWTGYEEMNTPSKKRYYDPYIFTKVGSKTYTNEFGPDKYANCVKSFIQSYKDESMFIYFPMVLTHLPYTHTPLKSPKTKHEKFVAMVEYMDKIVGDVVKTIDNAGIRENTVIIWTTDNGTSQSVVGDLNGRKVRGEKAKTTELGINMPFIANWKGVTKAGVVTDALVDFTDFFPTCMDLAGLEVKSEILIDGEKRIIDGISFKPVLINQSENHKREWILGMGGRNNAKLTEKGVENKYKYRDRVVRNKHYKLEVNTKSEPVAFYHISIDKYQEKNLIENIMTREQKENYNELLKVIKSLPKQDNDPSYIPNPSQEWDVKISAKSQLWKK
jgi:arylsulfatase A-like enzyme